MRGTYFIERLYNLDHPPAHALENRICILKLYNGGKGTTVFLRIFVKQKLTHKAQYI